MNGNSDGEKQIGLENLMIELDNFDEDQEQEKSVGFDVYNRIKLKKHKKLQKIKDKYKIKDKIKDKKKLKDKLKDNHQKLELINQWNIKKKDKRKIIIIDENENLEQNKDLQVKGISQNHQKQITSITKNERKIQNLCNSVVKNNQDNQCNNNFQENLRVKHQQLQPKVQKERDMQTENNCDIKKLEIFHLLKISQNFILSMHSLTDKIIKMYV